MLRIALKRMLLLVYKHLPAFFRWQISRFLGSKFLTGMVFVVENDGKLLLVKHTYQKAWGLPGGWLKHNETIEEGARREIQEEFGTTIADFRVLKTVAIKSRPVIDIVIACRFAGPPTADRVEIETFGYFALEAIPTDIIRAHKDYIDEIAFRGQPRISSRP